MTSSLSTDEKKKKTEWLTRIFDVIGTLRVNFLVEASSEHTGSIPTSISRVASAVISIGRQAFHIIDALVNGLGELIFRHLWEIFPVQNQCGISIELIVSNNSRLIEDALHCTLEPRPRRKKKEEKVIILKTMNERCFCTFPLPTPDPTVTWARTLVRTTTRSNCLLCLYRPPDPNEW